MLFLAGKDTKNCKEAFEVPKIPIYEYDNRCLEFYSSLVNWYEAERTCIERNKGGQGRLAVIITKQKKDSILAFIKKRKEIESSSFWVGMNNHRWRESKYISKLVGRLEKG